MFFTGATVPGSSSIPNEDWAATTSDLVVLLDGATARTETGCHHGAAWYTRKLGASIIAGAASRATPLQEVLAAAIRQVAALHPECDLTHPGTPSAAGAIVRVEHDTVHYAVLGDVTIVFDTPGGVRTISDQRVSQTAASERAEADAYLIGSPEKADALVRMKHAELAAKNHDGGFWIAAADPDVVRHAIYGSILLGDLGRLAVLSDGAARAVDTFNLLDWSEAMDLLATAGPTALIRRVRSAEEQDPVGRTWPRNKKSDDATAVFADAPVSGLVSNKQSERKTSPVITSPEHAAMIHALLAEFQNNPRIMGGDTPFRDASGRACRAEQSTNWHRRIALQTEQNLPGPATPA